MSVLFVDTYDVRFQWTTCPAFAHHVKVAVVCFMKCVRSFPAPPQSLIASLPILSIKRRRDVFSVYDNHMFLSLHLILV